MQVHEIVYAIIARTGLQMAFKCPSGEFIWIGIDIDVGDLTKMIGNIALDTEIPWIRRAIWG